MKNLKAIALPSLVSLILIGAASLQAADRMKSGQWEVSVTDNGRTATNTHCDKPEQVKMANGSPEEIRASLEKSAAALHCTLQDFKMESDTISYTYACPGRSTASKTSYHGDSYETEVISKVGAEDHTRQIKGRRLGECP
jgi:Protein of unknown function (DUF3617)